MFRYRFHFFRTASVVALAFLSFGVFVAAVSAQDPAPLASWNGQSAVSYPTTLDLGIVFTAFFLMLGPIKIFVPFVQATIGMEQAEARRVALKAVGYASVIGVVAALLGQRILVSWGISLPALHLAAGVILMLVALRNMIALYAPSQDMSKSTTPPSNPALAPLAFPTILSPYGIAIFILFLAVSRDLLNDFIIFGIFLAVMLLNLLSMRYAQAIVKRGGTLFAILGAVIGVLLVALAVQMILDALRYMQVLPIP